jgi:hypothetical protein
MSLLYLLFGVSGPWTAINVANLVFGVGSIVLAFVLLPTLLHKGSRVPRSTSLPVAAVLLSFSLPYILLGTYFALICNTAQMLMWLLILVYRPLKEAP